MTPSLAWLALQSSDLGAATSFYHERLDLNLVSTSETEHEYRVGETTVLLRTPDHPTPGGAHVHYAFTTGPDGFDYWVQRLAEDFDLTFHDFGTFQSLYCFDADEHCVEIASLGEGGTALSGIFEVVLQVRDIDDAIPWYTQLGFTPGERDPDRPRIRLTSSQLDLELWEPHRGLADALPGEYVDLGIAVADVNAIVEKLPGNGPIVESKPGTTVFEAPGGHRLTLIEDGV